MPLVPYVIEKSGREERAMDIYSRLLKDRIIFLGSGVNDEVANAIVAQLLFLQSDDPKADVHLYINSPGGSVSAGLGIYDTMQLITCDVATYCVGMAASMGALLLTAGAEGKRHALPNARFKHNDPRSPESLLLGGPVLENKDKVAAANPITYIDKQDPPFLIVHGSQDPLVPVHQSQLLEAALKKAKVPVQLIVVEGAGHGGKSFNTPETNELIRKFFDQHVKQSPRPDADH